MSEKYHEEMLVYSVYTNSRCPKCESALDCRAQGFGEDLTFYLSCKNDKCDYEESFNHMPVWSGE